MYAPASKCMASLSQCPDSGLERWSLRAWPAPAQRPRLEYSDACPSTRELAPTALRPAADPLRAHAVPPLRAQRAEAAGDLARAVAELRRRPAAGDSRAILRRAFDLGITHFDLANNYGPPYGSAEINFGRIFSEDLAPYRDELVISTKAGYDMWPGPYGEWGSRKYLLGSLDQSLTRMGLDYVDIFYSHRFDPETPLEETMAALDAAVRAGQGALRRHLVATARAGPRRRRSCCATSGRRC